MTIEQLQSLTNQLQRIATSSALTWPEFSAAVLRCAQNDALLKTMLQNSTYSYRKPDPMKFQAPIKTGFD